MAHSAEAVREQQHQGGRQEGHRVCGPGAILHQHPGEHQQRGQRQQGQERAAGPHCEGVGGERRGPHRGQPGQQQGWEGERRGNLHLGHVPHRPDGGRGRPPRGHGRQTEPAGVRKDQQRHGQGQPESADRRGEQDVPPFERARQRRRDPRRHHELHGGLAALEHSAEPRGRSDRQGHQGGQEDEAAACTLFVLRGCHVSASFPSE